MDDAKNLLVGLLNYVKAMARMTEHAVFSVRSYRMLTILEHELKNRLGQNRVGIQHDVMDNDGAIWLRIERLPRLDPPAPDKDIAVWLTVSRDPNRRPEVSEQYLETMSRDKAQLLVNTGKVDQADVMPSPQGQDDIVDVRLRLDRFPEIQQAIDSYVMGPWRQWSEAETPRRETMAIYDRCFRTLQTIEPEGVENPTEVVFGTGMALWKTDGKTIEHPLIEALIEIDVDPKTHAIRIRPRETEPQVYLKPFEEIDNPGVAGLRKAAEDYFKSLAQQDTSEFSPFIRSSFEPVLRQAVTRLSASGVYYSDTTSDPTNRRLPEVSDTLTVTDTWAIYARPRSGNFYVQDIERLKEQVDKTAEQNLPLSGRSFVTPPTDAQVYKPGIDLQGGIGSSSFTGRAQSHSITTGTPTLGDHDVLFPKPYNDAQIEIIRRLETTPGVVVQGPPGTGKTHTIANIICHYLATGRSVLVTSKGEPALEVLHDQIPVEVRNLTINLLTNEREGLKQLERAVTFLANDVMNKDPQAARKGDRRPRTRNCHAAQGNRRRGCRSPKTGTVAIGTGS